MVQANGSGCLDREIVFEMLLDILEGLLEKYAEGCGEETLGGN